MATITSVTGSGLIHPIYNWETGSTWQGGIVPVSGDTVIIDAFRTTINQAAINAWLSGTINITVASTTGFPNSGYCYTYTSRSRKIKINYVSKTATLLSGCTIDQTYSKFDNSDVLSDGVISNTSYVIAPAPYIMINSGITAAVTLCTIQNGGILQVNSGGTFELRGAYLIVNDGSFIMENYSTFKYMLHNSLCRIIGGQYPLSTIIMRGDEVRTNAILSSDINIGDNKISCNNLSLFKIGDKISIYKKATDGNVPITTVDYRSNWMSNRLGVSGSTYDEGFDICGIDDGYLYLKLRNGIEGTILSATTTGGVATLYVDEQRFNVGDIINYNVDESEYSRGYTIKSVEDADYLLRDYNFASGATLADWTTDTGLTTYYANFTTDGTKLRHSTTSSNNIFIKDLWIKNVKVEAWMSPLDQITGGTRSESPFWLIIENDPVMDKNVSGSTSKSSMFVIDDSNNYAYLYKRYVGSSTTHTTTYMPSAINQLSLSSQLITNPSATVNLTNWYANGDTTITRITTDGPIGSTSIESSTVVGGTSNYLQYAVNTTSTYLYKLEFYAKSITGNTTLGITNIASLSQVITTSWVKYSFNIESASSASIRFYLASTGTFRISELSLNQIYSGVTQLDCRSLAKYTLENRKGFLKAYINDIQTHECMNRNDSFYGTVGIYTNNANFTCTRFKAYATCQKITIDTNDTFLSGNTICQSGAEYYHAAGQKIVKIGSIITNAAGHTDLAFGYQGRDNGYFPTVRGINSALDANAGVGSSYMLNHDIIRDNYLDFGTGTNKYFIVDLMRNVNFTHISYSQYYDIGVANTTLVNIGISGSTDGITWTEIYPTSGDTRLSCVATCLRYYNCGTLRNFRYIKFMSNGSSVATSNLAVQFGVHNFNSGYTLTLNNTSDLSIGDTINIYPKYTSGYGEYTETTFYANIVTNKVKNPSDYLSELKEYYTIIGKTGNTIALERPYVKSYLEGDGTEIVIKMNRNTKIIGNIAQNQYYKGTLQITNSWYMARKYIFENCEFLHHGSTQWGTSTETIGFSNQNTDLYNPVILDGLSYHSGYNGSTYSFHGYYGYFNIKNSILCNVLNLRCNQFSYNSYIINTNNFYIDTSYLLFASAVKSLQFNYNYLIQNSGFYLEFNSYTDNLSGINLIEVCRNYNCIFYLVSTYYQSQLNKKFIVENNFITVNTYFSATSYYLPYSMNNLTFNSEHFGLRTIAGTTSDGGFYPNKTYQNSILGRYPYVKNYNRWGYDLIGYYYGYIMKFPNTNFVRYYPYSTSYLSTLFGIDCYLLNDSDLNIAINFDYRLSYDQYYFYDTTYTNLGALTLYVVNNGNIIYTEAVPKSLNWYNYKYITKLNNMKKGRYSILFNIAQRDGYVDIRNSQGDINSSLGKDNIYMYANTVDGLEPMYNPLKYLKNEFIPLTTDTTKKIIFAGRSMM
jgi:hypothetical protein